MGVFSKIVFSLLFTSDVKTNHAGHEMKKDEVFLFHRKEKLNHYGIIIYDYKIVFSLDLKS